MTTAPNKPVMSPVIYAGRCRGFLLRRGAAGVEAFTADQASIGTYADEAAAVAAIFQHTAGGR
jgi:hypothetical protein